MRLASVNVASLRTVDYKGRSISTGIFKKPVQGPVRVRTLGIEGDEQGDLKAHGGIEMAVYGYTSENYVYWRAELGGLTESQLPPGTFGENLTIDGLDETGVCIGDRFAIGDVELEVSLPRAPCSTLAMVMQDPEFPKRFLATARVGFYLRVVREGSLQIGDSVSQTHRDAARLSIPEVVRLMFFDKDNRPGWVRAEAVETLAPKWRERFRKKLDGAS